MHHVADPLHRLVVGGARREADPRPDRRHDDHDVLDIVEDRDDRRTQEDAVRHAELVGILLRQVLDQPHHVVAHIAEDAGGHRRQALGHLDAALADEGTQGIERGLFLGGEGIRIGTGVAVDLRLVAAAAPDHVGLQADDRIAAAHRTALDRFQQEGIGAAVGQLQHGRDRRLEIGDALGPDQLRPAAGVARGEILENRLGAHGAILKSAS